MNGRPEVVVPKKRERNQVWLICDDVQTAALDAEAERLGITRSKLIRLVIEQSGMVPGFGTAEA